MLVVLVTPQFQLATRGTFNLMCDVCFITFFLSVKLSNRTGHEGVTDGTPRGVCNSWQTAASQWPHCVLRSAFEATELQTQPVSARPVPRDMSESGERSGHGSLRQSLLSGTKVVLADVFYLLEIHYFLVAGHPSQHRAPQKNPRSSLIRLPVEQSPLLNRIRIQRYLSLHCIFMRE